MEGVRLFYPLMSASSDGFFATTRWTMVQAAGASADDALESLCSVYWFPVYAFVRRRGFGKEDAEDLTQAFFANLLLRQDLSGLKKENGRFRAFLLSSIKNFLSNERDRRRRVKRGGNITHLSLDWQSADTKFQIADENQMSPDAAYDREWAVALLEKVITLLQEEAKSDGKSERFDCLKSYLTTEKGEIPYALAAKELAMDEGAVRVSVHRLRKRYRELLKKEVEQTLTDPSLLGDEMNTLLAAFR